MTCHGSFWELHTTERVNLECDQSWLKNLHDCTRFCCRKRRTLQWRSVMLQDPLPTLLDESSAIPTTHSVSAVGVKGGSLSCAALKAHCIYNRKVTHTPQWAASLSSVLPGFMRWRQRRWGSDSVRKYCCAPQLPRLHCEEHRLSKFPSSRVIKVNLWPHHADQVPSLTVMQLLPTSWQFLFYITLAKCNLLCLGYFHSWAPC